MSEALLLKSVESGLEEVEAIPLWGTPPPFPWESFGDMLAKNLEVEKAYLSIKKAEHLPFDELTSGLGEQPSVIPFALSPLPGTCFLLTSQATKKSLVQLLLYADHKGKEINDETLEGGFFTTVLLITCGVFSHLNPFGNLSAVLEEEAPPPEEGAFCLDIELKLGKSPFNIRLAIPKGPHAAFRTHFAMEKPPLLADPSLKDLPLPLHLEAGSTTLSAAEWKQVVPGDLVLLDRCTYDLEHNRGTAQLTLGNTPLFDVRIKEGEVKILEHALHLEEPAMTEETPPEEEKLPPLPEAPPEAPPETPIEGSGEEAPLWSAPESGEAESEMLASKEIPLSLVVEVGRFKMPLEKLTKLQPGNVLDLALNPQLGVHLTIGGKRVAKGELVKIGEGIGVKILKVGE